MTPTKPELDLTTTLAVPTFGRDRVLMDTLGQIASLSPGPDEVLVIDQTPDHTPEVEAFLREGESAGRFRVIHQPPGFMAALNRALTEATGQVFLICDDDVEIPTDWVGAHLKNYADPTVAAVAGRVDDRRWTDSEKPGKSDGRWRTVPYSIHYRTFPLDHPERVESIGVFRGCNWSARRALLVKIGGFDDDFIGTAMGNEPDVAMRLIAAGGRIVYDPEAGLTHLGAARGGCRIDNSGPAWPEWLISYPENYYVARHVAASEGKWWILLGRHARRFVLRRDNVFRPWRLPWALASHGYSVGRALSRARWKKRLIHNTGKAYETRELAP